jgi:hypothetical protein
METDNEEAIHLVVLKSRRTGEMGSDECQGYDEKSERG